MDLGGSGWIWVDLGGSGWIWVVGGSGLIWDDMKRCWKQKSIHLSANLVYFRKVARSTCTRAPQAHQVPRRRTTLRGAADADGGVGN